MTAGGGDLVSLGLFPITTPPPKYTIIILINMTIVGTCMRTNIHLYYSTRLVRREILKYNLA